MPRARPAAAAVRPILLVGNGPNRVSPAGVSWADLMQTLRRAAGMRADGHDAKPFTLHFEEIRNGYLARTAGASEAGFLRRVAKEMEALRPNDVHRRLTWLAVGDILTTNYDDCLERSLAASAIVANFDTNESKHNLFRRSRIGRRHFWHLHGDIFRPNSVLLGHDRYVEGAAHIRRYCDPTLGLPFKAHAAPLTAVFRGADARIDAAQPHSWVDLLLLRDVHIVGFGLDYTEVDLWYLLSLRHRLRRSASPQWRALRRTRIVFHHFDAPDEALRQKRELLASFDVECRSWPLPDGDYGRGWDGLLRGLERELGTRA
jgi:hypothetical protein